MSYTEYKALYKSPSLVVTFGVRRSRGEMYIGHAVCLSVRRHIPTLMHGPGCNLDEW